MSKNSIENLLILVAITIPMLFLYFIFKFINYSIWVEAPLAIILYVIIAAILFGLGTYVLEKALPEYCGKEGLFYHPIWKSKEFDDFIGDELLELYKDNCSLFEDYKAEDYVSRPSELSDYSHLVLPIAKIYEGVLKKILVQNNLLKEDDLINRPSINVSTYFNPTGNKNIFNILKDKARDKAVPHVIYATYQECRNQILHYDPYRDNRIKSIEDAEFYQRRILDAIDKAYITFKKT